MSIYDPIVRLPDDTVYHGEVLTLAPDFWHIDDLVKKAQAEESGEFAKIAVLDTGCTAHDALPEPIAAKSFISGENWRDGNGHGTHCAGTALGRKGFGLCQNAGLIVGKCLSNSGSGSSQAITDAIYWAVEQGADVISMSLGSGSAYEPMRKACLHAWNNGVIVVAAAGNSGFNGRTNTIGFPGKFLETLCIGAYRRDGLPASFSSGGREMDIICPGQDILSCSLRNGIASMSGTSMATPFAAGVCGWIVSKMRRQGRAAFTGVEAARQFIAENSTDRGPSGHDPANGYGVPRANDMIAKMTIQGIKYLM